jgi:hypothetical protein
MIEEKKKSKGFCSLTYQQKTEMLTKEKSNKKEKGVNNQNNSPFHFELFPVINTFKTSSSILKLILKTNSGG